MLMRSFRSPIVWGLVLLLGWFAFVLTQYTLSRFRMRGIAEALWMKNRTFYMLPDPLKPTTAVQGEERMLVVGQSNDDFLVCSIVRNSSCSDFRSKWYVDQCYRPDLNPGHPRTAIWMSFDQFPSEMDLELFRAEALKQPWVRWDHPDGTDPPFDASRWSSE